MPIKRDSLPVQSKETLLKSLEKYRLAVSTAQMNMGLTALLLAALRNRRCLSRPVFQQVMAVITVSLGMVTLNEELVSLPHMKSPSQGGILEVAAWNNVDFYTQFRFRKGHFYIFLDALGWLSASGQPVLISFGCKGHRYTIEADHIMKILLCRLSFPCRWADL
jgi:hypothetical protein